MGFARDHIYVTKQKDNELWASHANNNLDTANPVIDFDKYLDGDSLDQQDLVLWVNLGMTHIPHTGDLPTTTQPTAQSSFILLPHNYLTSDPSRRTHQQVRVSYGEWQNHSTKVKTFGQEAISYGQTYPLSEAVGNLLDYQGDIAVRKFPYAQHPYNDTQSIV